MPQKLILSCLELKKDKAKQRIVTFNSAVLASFKVV